MDVLTKEQRRKNMQAIRSTGTKAELLLSKRLWSLGFRYRKNDRTVLGKPDLTFKRLKIAIFVDSEYFHGRNWDTNKHRIKTNSEFWWKKIESNIDRDIKVNDELKANGWSVLRFWDTQVKSNLTECIDIIERKLNEWKKVD
ncbi:MAG: very short patch repair endonuclease [Bacteroidetes bacterium]|nr:very short patch repair endonuclease [Bacteroidota bacterium]